MKITSKIMLTACLIFFGLTAVQAQRGGGWRNATPEQMAEKQTTHMTQALGLNDEQVAKVKGINLKYAQKREEVKEVGEVRQESMQKLREAKKAELKSVLTKEQYEKLDAIQRQGKPYGFRGMNKGPCGPRFGGFNADPGQMAEMQTNHMVQKLGLNEDQAGKLEKINLKYANERKAIRDKHHEELKKVLTEEQYQELEEMRPGAPPCPRKGKGKRGKRMY